MKKLNTSRPAIYTMTSREKLKLKKVLHLVFEVEDIKTEINGTCQN